MLNSSRLSGPANSETPCPEEKVEFAAKSHISQQKTAPHCCESPPSTTIQGLGFLAAHSWIIWDTSTFQVTFQQYSDSPESISLRIHKVDEHFNMIFGFSVLSRTQIWESPNLQVWSLSKNRS